MRTEPGVTAHVYSGRSGTVDGGTHLHLPLTMVDITLAPGAVFEQDLPGSYRGFVYPLHGDLTAGADAEQRLGVAQIGWLADSSRGEATAVRLVAGAHGARVLLYAGERQRVPIVTHGPFVGETRADLMRVSWAYSQGEMPRLGELRSV